MGVLIDQVDGEIKDQPSGAPAPAAPAGQPDQPEAELEELQHKLAVMHRRRARLFAD
jgi:hypothetical protein